MIRLLRSVLLALGLLSVALAARAETPDAALDGLLQAARADCAQPSDRLSRVLCSGRLRAGVRDYYPLFGTREGEERSGYEPDLARAIAKRLGVEVEFSRVSASPSATARTPSWCRTLPA
jgi:ABC-type amino acid transport substrate-binding protein